MTYKQTAAIENIVLSLNQLLSDFTENQFHITVEDKGENLCTAEIDCYFTDRALVLATLIDRTSVVTINIENELIKLQ